MHARPSEENKSVVLSTMRRVYYLPVRSRTSSRFIVRMRGIHISFSISSNQSNNPFNSGRWLLVPVPARPLRRRRRPSHSHIRPGAPRPLTIPTALHRRRTEHPSRLRNILLRLRAIATRCWAGSTAHTLIVPRERRRASPASQLRHRDILRAGSSHGWAAVRVV